MNIKRLVIFLSILVFSSNTYSISLEDFDLNADSQQKALSKNGFKRQTRQARLHMQDGRPSHFDEAMGKRTFIWAPENQSTAATRIQAAKPDSKNKNKNVEIAKAYLFEHFSRKESVTFDNALSKSVSGEEIYPVSTHESTFGPMVFTFRQKINGTEVFAREANVLMDSAKNLVAVSGYLADAKPVSVPFSKKNVRVDRAAVAIKQAYADMGIQVSLSKSTSKTRSSSPYVHYSASTKDRHYKILDMPRAKKIWYEYQGNLLAAHYVEVSVIEKKQQGEEFQYGYVISEVSVDQSSSKVLFRKNQIQHESFTYRTFADADDSNSPFRGPMKNIYPIVGLNPEQAVEQVPVNFLPDAHQLISLDSGPISTGDPWLSPGATETIGNNVNAYADIHPRDGFTSGDVRADTSGGNTFDWVYDPDAPASLPSRKASVVNLFYMTNWLHDYFYDFGFDEAAGNAQTNNYGRGGIDGDLLRAEAQDYRSVNNANMSTPADGGNPRMQMYIYGGFHKKGESFDVTAVSGEMRFTLDSARLAQIGSEEYGPIHGELVLVEETCITPTDPDAINGKIALVRQSRACLTAESVKYAQDSGAKAVILIGRSRRSAPRIYVVDSGVEVPSLSVNRTEGNALRAALKGGEVIQVSMHRDYIPNRDGALDNAIVAHEWGHYLTNRLVGDSAGLVNIQGRGMGEGWSDFLSIYFSVEERHRDIPGNETFQGLYSRGGWANPNPYYGNRRVPYTTDMRYNAVLFENVSTETPYEFDHPIAFTSSNNAQVHRQGEFWANTLWEVYASLLNDSPRLSFKDARARMAYYLVAGLKLTPIAPTYIEARDGMLAVAYATDRDDYNRMLAAFAKRGLGLRAVAADRFSVTNIGTVNSFDTDVSAFSVVSSRIEIEKTYSGLNLSEHSDPVLSSLSFLDGDVFQCPKDGVLDIFEFGEVVMTLQNTGNMPVQNIVAQLTSDAGHGIYFAQLGRVTLESIAPYSNTIELRVPFVLFNATTAQQYAIDIDFLQTDPEVDYPATQTHRLTVHHDYAADSGRLIETAENTLTARHDWQVQVDEPAPTSSVFDRILSSTFTLDGGVNNDTYFTGQMWRGLDNALRSDVSLISPMLEASHSEAFRIQFDHAHVFERGNDDGAVIEVSIDGGAWQDVTEAGGEIQGYGYNGRIRSGSNTISRRLGFIDVNEELVNTRVDFGTLLAGSTVQFRFRIVTDSRLGAPGWLIDNIAFEGIDNSPFSKIVPHNQWCH